MSFTEFSPLYCNHQYYSESSSDFLGPREGFLDSTLIFQIEIEALTDLGSSTAFRPDPTQLTILQLLHIRFIYTHGKATVPASARPSCVPTTPLMHAAHGILAAYPAGQDPASAWQG